MDMQQRFDDPKVKAQAIYNLATTWVKHPLGSLPKAIRYFAQAAELLPDWVLPYESMAKLFIGRNHDLLKTDRLFSMLPRQEQESVISALQQLAEVDPHIGTMQHRQWEVSRYCLGVCLYSVGEANASTEIYRAIVNAPERPRTPSLPPLRPDHQDRAGGGAASAIVAKLAVRAAVARAKQRGEGSGEAVAVIAMATDNTESLQHMLHSARLSGHNNVHVLGMGQEFKANSMKLDLYMHFLEQVSGSLNKHDSTISQ
jgi:hypothetical protein